jgi:pyridoxine 4-dehydrogenase
MAKQLDLGGSFIPSGTSMSLKRIGYGAMQLAGPQVWGPPRDMDAAVSVLREAVAAGVNHIDTSDFYGPHVTNQIIKRALHPYPDGLVIVDLSPCRYPTGELVSAGREDRHETSTI